MHIFVFLLVSGIWRLDDEATLRLFANLESGFIYLCFFLLEFTNSFLLVVSTHLWLTSGVLLLSSLLCFFLA